MSNTRAARDREELRRQVAEFEARGGRVEQVPIDQYRKATGRPRAMMTSAERDKARGTGDAKGEPGNPAPAASE